MNAGDCGNTIPDIMSVSAPDVLLTSAVESSSDETMVTATESSDATQPQALPSQSENSSSQPIGTDGAVKNEGKATPAI